MKKEIYIIGSGFSSLSAACYLAKDGYAVTVLEKNATLGGRARQLSKDGFTFDMGPTWYWMPDVFDRFFADFNKKTSDYYELEKLSPAYHVYFGKNDVVSVADNLPEIRRTFESIEPGSGQQLDRFMATAKNNYDIAIGDMVYKPGESFFELVSVKTAIRLKRFLTSIRGDIRRKFNNRKLIQLLEFPVLFLGAKPSNTPSFYSFMNHADFGLGTWYPQKGMYTVVEAIEKLALELGVVFETNAAVNQICCENGKVSGLLVNGQFREATLVLSGADYHHTEQLLERKFRAYSDSYWKSRVFAPSSLLFYLGFDKKIANVAHHTLFFDADFEQHAKDIYDLPKWPESPLFYASFPSQTDESCAPQGHEAAILLIPLAPGLKDTQFLRDRYFEKIMHRLEEVTQQSLRNNLVFKESFCVNDFTNDYNSYKGNAYGMANTLLQTAFLRPKLRSRNVRNLYFTGQLTVPGPGVPPALISGKLSAALIRKYSST
jgi:phytoene desaturase